VLDFEWCSINLEIMITMYCIVYIYIYIAVLEEHTNQKRFQCERPKEKRAVSNYVSQMLKSMVHKATFQALDANLQIMNLEILPWFIRNNVLFWAGLPAIAHDICHIPKTALRA